MTYKEEMQWSELERLLPKIRSSFEKAKEFEILKKSARLLLHEELEKKAKMLSEMIDACKVLVNLGINIETVINEVEKKANELHHECKKLLKEIEEKVCKAEQIRKELNSEEEYYKNVSIFFKGIKIKKKQITPKEFESLLYFMCITELKPEELFENFCEMYPWITYGCKKRNSVIP